MSTDSVSLADLAACGEMDYLTTIGGSDYHEIAVVVRRNLAGETSLVGLARDWPVLQHKIRIRILEEDNSELNRLFWEQENEITKLRARVADLDAENDRFAEDRLRQASEIAESRARVADLERVIDCLRYEPVPRRPSTSGECGIELESLKELGVHFLNAHPIDSEWRCSSCASKANGRSGRLPSLCTRCAKATAPAEEVSA